MSENPQEQNNSPNPERDLGTLVLGDIYLDFESKADSFVTTFIQFLKKNREALGLKVGTNLVEEYLARVWPDNLPNSMIISHASSDGFPRFIIRPPVDGPKAASFAANGIAPAFTVYLSQGKLVVDGFTLVAHIALRRFERYCSGQFHRMCNGGQMSQADLNTLASLPHPRQRTASQLDTWLDCLNWQQKLAVIGQESFRYEAYTSTENGSLHFLVRCSKLSRLIRKGRVVMLAAPLTDSLSPERWEPDPANRPTLVRLGQVIKARRLNKKSRLHREFSSNIDRDQLDDYAVITVQTDTNGNSRSVASLVPFEGFLLSSIGGDIKPISSAKRAIHRFTKGRGHNIYLPDYMFEVTNAAAPEDINEFSFDDSAFDNLNREQRMAISKCLAAPDIGFIEGPPGTGKTTVIAAICYIEVKSGRRVLIVSQSNDAVDNALIRLLTDPSIRPLRIGNPSRSDPDSRIFFGDQVLAFWLDAVRGDCLRQTDRNGRLERKIADAKQAFSNLKSVLGNYQRTIEKIGEQNQAKDDLEKQKEELIAGRKRVAEAVEHFKRQQTVLEDLSAWASRPHNSLPSLELLSEPSLQELGRQTIEAIKHTLSVVLDSINDVEAASADQTEPNKFNSSGGGSWSRLMTRIKTTVRNISSRGPWQIPWARIDKIESSCSSWLRLASFQRAAAAAKLLHPLLFKAIASCQNVPEETTEWSAICRDIQAHLPGIFDAAIPADLDHLTASLKSDGGWLAILENLAVLCETLTGPCRKIFADALARIHQQAETQKNNIKAETSDAQGQLDKNKAAVREIDADIREVRYTLDELQIQLNEQRARWSELWPQICPDLEEVPVTPAEITRDAIDQRRSDFDAWLSGQQESRKLQQQWDSIRRDWIARISDPRTAENKDLQSDYAKHANVVGLTCLESGQKSFYEDDDFKAFDTIIIDEVSKATPPELLMAMMCGRRVFLFADYRQLSPMYKQRESSHTEAVAEGQIAAEDFERYRQLVTSSFFQEMFEAAPDSIRQSLLEQFRMHPQIMAVINQFYDGKLIAAGGPEQLDKLRQHYLVIRDRQGGWFLEPSQHALWIDSSKDARGRIVTEKQLGSSKLNLLEVELVLASLSRLNKALRKRGYGPSRDFKAGSAEDGMRLGDWIKKLMPYAAEQTIADLFTRRQIKIDKRSASPEVTVREGNALHIDARMPIGVITFYGAQLGHLRKAIDNLRAKDPSLLDAIDVKNNTVDKFQGREMPIVIVSLVRASQSGHVGEFVKEYRRINVAFSRAQNLLIIVGSERTYRNAVVELPSMDDGTIRKVAVYRNIYNLITQFGGRRYAKQLLAS